VRSTCKKETRAHKCTFAELEENEQDLLRLTRWLRKIQQRDFFPGPSSRAAHEHIISCRQALQTFTTTVYEQEGLPSPGQQEALSEGSVPEEGKESETW
jgi:phosphoketolase